jgi:predicted nucleic acid-binding protein
MRPPVISNSSPIIHLGKINQLHLLKDLFGEILIPKAVHEECVVQGKNRPEVDAIVEADWLKVHETTDKNLIKLLRSEIDQGEAESIALAIQIQAGLILLDDSEAREKARLYDLPICGTLGVLLRAKLNGKLSSLSTALTDLQASGFWIQNNLVDRLLLEANEKK